MSRPTAVYQGLHYSDTQGGGPSIVLLHGLGNSLTFWDPVIEQMRDRRVIAVDFPGYGKSLPPSEVGPDALTRPIHGLLKYLEAHPCIIAGHSLGGLAALHYTRALPADVLSLVMLDAHLFSASDLLSGKLSLIASPSFTIAVAAQFLGGLVPMKGPLPSLITSTAMARQLLLWPFVFNPRRIAGNVLRSALAGNAGPSGVLAAYRLSRSYDLREVASAIRCPVDLVWGAHDRLLRDRDHQEARMRLPIRRTLEIAETGHWPQLERPNAVADFLREV